MKICNYIFLLSTIFFLIVCNGQESSVIDSRLKINGQNPLILNYGVQITWAEAHPKNIIWLSSDFGYGQNWYADCLGQTACDNEIQNQLNYISGMGFNAIRLTNLCPYYEPGSGLFKMPIHKWDGSDGAGVINITVNPDDPNDEGRIMVFGYIEKMLRLASQATPNPLKVIYLNYSREPIDSREHLGLAPNELEACSNYLNKLASFISSSSYKESLFAYDLLNEPCDFYLNKRPTKKQACTIVSTWVDALKQGQPDCLVTIGSCGIDDIWAFDPYLLNVDFQSIHRYPWLGPNEKTTNTETQLAFRNRLANELFWFNAASKVPWIVGENGFSTKKDVDADYASAHFMDGTVYDQVAYAEFAMKATAHCGGSGFSWWNYQDLFWPAGDITNPKFKNAWYGLISLGENPSQSSEKQPTVDVFRYKNFIGEEVGTNNCPCQYSESQDGTKSYYNWRGYNTDGVIMEGQVKSTDNVPLPNAVLDFGLYLGKDNQGHEIRDQDLKYLTDVLGNYKAYYDYSRFPFIRKRTLKIEGILVSSPGGEVQSASNPNLTGTLQPVYWYLRNENFDNKVSSVTLNSGNTWYTADRSVTLENCAFNSGSSVIVLASKEINLSEDVVIDEGCNFSAYLQTVNTACSSLPDMFVSLKPQIKINSSAITKNNRFIKSNEIVMSINKPDVEKENIILCPNPTQNLITISTKNEITNITIYSQFGYDVSEQALLTDSNKINFTNLPAGIYLLSFDEGKKRVLKKVIKY